ncbi:MAG: PAS domain S-box protein, partial [Cyanobacteriota bacterium]|nr:PAS domain S-box protein [Cyanobacteriota bacterium]
MSKNDRPGILERSAWDNFSYEESGDRVFPKRDLPTADIELAREVAERKGLEQRYCSLFENASVGIYQIAPDGTIVRVNPALARLLGYHSPEQFTAAIVNFKQQLYVDPQQNQHFIELMYERGSLSDFQSQVYRRDGSIIWISETVCSISDAENRLIYYEGFVSDITQLKEAEQALRKLEAKHNSKVRQFKNTAKLLQQSQTQLRHREKLSSLGQLLAEVAHEIKNPVTFVGGNVSPATHYARDLILLLQLYQKHYPQPDPEIAEFARDIDLDFIVDDLPKTLGSMKMGIDKICNLVRSLQSFSRF